MNPYMITFILVFLLALALRFYLSKRNKNTDQVYDERQILIRGRAYKIGFLTTILLTVIFLVTVGSNPDLSSYSIAFLSIPLFGGVLAFAGYSIVKDAFFSIKQNIGSYMILCLAVVVSQFVNVFSKGDWKSISTLFTSDTVISLCCGITFLLILLLIIGKYVAEQSKEESN